jgi:hypothetical protein
LADDDTEFHPRTKRTHYLHVRISDEDRRALIRLSRARAKSASEVVRDLIQEALSR